ncbi:MAG: cheYIII [Phenylobacterium sp.]|nr:cheYIII [Phenylobacterium sp.]
MTERNSEARLNLTKATVLLLQNNQAELDILGQVFIGFGVKAIRKCLTVAEAEDIIGSGVLFDLIVVDCDMPGFAGYDFVAKLRRAEQNDNRLAPMMLVSGHTVPSSISKARDCGANFVVAKPITPKVMFDRVMWLAREERQFVVTDSYAGPDRRHKTFGPPPGVKGRRREDVTAKMGASNGPDMSQDDIDALLNPKRASL